VDALLDKTNVKQRNFCWYIMCESVCKVQLCYEWWILLV